MKRSGRGLEEYCLGLEWLGQCTAAAAPSLAVGEALIVAALLLALYRFGGRIVQMRWRTRGLTERALVVALCVSVAPALVAAALRVFGPPWARVPVVG